MTWWWVQRYHDGNAGRTSRRSRTAAHILRHQSCISPTRYAGYPRLSVEMLDVPLRLVHTNAARLATCVPMGVGKDRRLQQPCSGRSSPRLGTAWSLRTTSKPEAGTGNSAEKRARDSVSLQVLRHVEIGRRSRPEEGDTRTVIRSRAESLQAGRDAMPSGTLICCRVDVLRRSTTPSAL
ncbi:hypothetical protein K466DRAFT_13811 [Polyporus arcularius HHB13444]|uniref:Uncharacterized protein n=1 Tax=Polyporus arcularius HHB13444 TaxID=1314778 RepID=A0A5C3NSZ8_9APHY|nr:hypothetical protein K466DRAFT_13811 [Polyporus arcularius HHB13444]